MTIYISTPVTSRREPTLAEKTLAAHHRVFMLKELLAADTRFCDCDFLSTFDVNTNIYDTESQILGRCITALLEADAIYLDHGWNASKGCNLEYRAAKIYNLQILEHDNL